MRISGRPTRVTEEQYRKLMEVKAARAAIPSNKVLAREFGLPVATVQTIIFRGLKRYGGKHGR